MFSDELEYFRLDGADLIVGAIRVSQALSVEFEDSAETRLVINGAFVLASPERASAALSADQPQALTPLFAILRDRVRELVVQKASGDLTVDFVSGTHLSVPATPAYEA